MALRIHDAVVKGEIDNRERGRVIGRLWLAGRHEPVVLDLKGNCHRDLAGCVACFKNPSPGHDAAIDLNALQKGAAGDMTASRKVRILDVPVEEAMRLSKAGKPFPEHRGNSLYLEWFSDTNGRVVIESADYEITLSDHSWVLSPEDEERQIEEGNNAIREWLDNFPGNDELEEYDPDADKPLDEFGYEKFLKECDARTDKYGALLEKYMDHPDRDKIVAREMGWEWLEDALEADERGALPKEEESEEILPLEPDPTTEGIDWVRDEDGCIHHPLTNKVRDVASKMWRRCNEDGLLGESGDSDLQEMIFQLQTTGAKTAGALNSLAYGRDLREAAFVVACLKRALNYLHQSITAAGKVAEKNPLPAGALEKFREDQFAIREEMLSLMEEFRGDSR